MAITEQELKQAEKRMALAILLAMLTSEVFRFTL